MSVRSHKYSRLCNVVMSFQLLCIKNFGNFPAAVSSPATLAYASPRGTMCKYLIQKSFLEIFLRQTLTFNSVLLRFLVFNYCDPHRLEVFETPDVHERNINSNSSLLYCIYLDCTLSTSTDMSQHQISVMSTLIVP